VNDRLGREFLYLSHADVRELNLPMAEIVAVLERTFREKGEGRVEMPPKPGVHTMPDAFLHAMPAYIPAQKAVGLKWVGGYPQNHERKLPYITGLPRRPNIVQNKIRFFEAAAASPLRLIRTALC
jgi:ornithine cyclodeaminase/alanine dehydrogenase